MSADVETSNMTTYLVGQSPSPDFLPDEESASMCPLIVPSPSSSAADFQVDTLGLAPQSSTADFIRDEESCSICPLLTPSPTGADFTQSMDPLTALVYQAGEEQTNLSKTNNYTEFDCKRKSGSVSDEGDEQQISFTVKSRTSIPCELLESSASSSSSALQETTCVQLLGNSVYQHLSADKNEVGAFIPQENGKSTTLDMSSHKRTPDYCFMSWNWPLIRKTCLFSVISVAVACFCVVVGIVGTLPSRCYPFHFWYQGSVFYEIFSASFQDSNMDGTGDFKGIVIRADYIQKLGVRAIRLNPIFATHHYPEDFMDAKNLTEIEPSLGSIKDFGLLLDVFHRRNIRVILDLPIYPLVKNLSEYVITGRKDVEGKITNTVHNHRSHRTADNETEQPKRIRVRREICCFDPEDKVTDPRIKLLKPYIDGGISGLMKQTSQHLNSISETIVADAIKYWLDVGVDGFYIKGLGNYINDPKFEEELRKFKKITYNHWSMDKEKILMCDYQDLRMAEESGNEVAVEALLNNMDLIDVYVDISNGTHAVKHNVHKYDASRLYDKQYYPWIHWNIGNADTKRVSTETSANASIGAILFEMMLPGTVSIFYGDEIGLQELHDPHRELWDIKPVHQLTPMRWPSLRYDEGFTRGDIMPWIPFTKSLLEGSSEAATIVQTLAIVREDSPSIYMNSIWKDDERLFNYEIRYVDDDIIIIERSYPRRNSFIAVTNLGNKIVTKDLSHTYYGGQLVADCDNNVGAYLSFKSLIITPGNTLVVKLDK